MICLQIIGCVVSAIRRLTRTHLVNDCKTHKDDRKANYPKMYSHFSGWVLNTSSYSKMVGNTFLCDNFALVFLLTSTSTVVKTRVTRATFPARFDSRDRSICFLQGQYQHLSLLIKETDILNQLGLQQYKIFTAPCKKIISVLQ